MKAYEILVEYKIEKPAGLVSQGLKKAGAAALGALGAKHAAGALKGSAEIGDRANAYEKEFQKYLSGKGKDTIDIEYVDLNDFIKQNSLPSPKLPGDGYVATGDLENIFMDIAKLSAKGAAANAEQPAGQQAGAKTTQTPAAGAQQQAKPEQPTAAAEKPAEPAAPSVVTADDLLSSFQEYVDADGKITPELRGAVKTLWMKMGGVKAESVKKKAKAQL